MSSSIAIRASSCAAPRVVKNSRGNRSDIAWKHVEDEGSDDNEILDFTIEEDEVGGIGGTQDEEDGAVPNEDECEMHNLDDDIEGEEDDMEDMGVGIDENLLKDLMN
ncbi:hypothetical protein P8452_51735 [Trifolium repens]|nr:hypothetical protein P8452_51735 [Trifolium repens]